MNDFDPTELIKMLESADRHVQDAAVGAAEVFAEQVLADSQELCPVSPVDKNHPFYTGHSGALRDSGTVKPAEIKGGSVTVEIGYNANYAAAVHERLDASHRYPGPVTPNAQAKFLETPLRASAPRFGPFLREAVDAALKRS